nr:hypothetical protein Q903MT_gene4829 [Picea sitchensis]
MRSILKYTGKEMRWGPKRMILSPRHTAFFPKLCRPNSIISTTYVPEGRVESRLPRLPMPKRKGRLLKILLYLRARHPSHRPPRSQSCVKLPRQKPAGLTRSIQALICPMN